MSSQYFNSLIPKSRHVTGGPGSNVIKDRISK